MIYLCIVKVFFRIPSDTYLARMQDQKQLQQESTVEDDTFGPMPLAKLEVTFLVIFLMAILKFCQTALLCFIDRLI